MHCGFGMVYFGSAYNSGSPTPGHSGSSSGSGPITRPDKEIIDMKAVFRIRIHLIRIRIQHFRPNADPDPDPIRIRIQSGSRVLMTKSWKKVTAEKKFNFFLSKTTIYLSLGLHKGRPSYRRSLQLSKENIQHFKTCNFWIFFYFCGSFLPSWIRIQIRIPNTDPDPLTWLNPDPKHCMKGLQQLRTLKRKYWMIMSSTGSKNCNVRYVMILCQNSQIVRFYSESEFD